MTTISSTSTALLQSLQNLQAKLKDADTDGNGSLSEAEFTAAAKVDPNLTGGTQSALAEFKKLDTDGNGQVTSSELTSGINLATQVQSALLQGQELQSGSAFLALLGGGSGSSSSSSLFGSGTNDFSSLTSSLLGGGDSSSSLVSLLSGGNANSSALSQLLGSGDSTADTLASVLGGSGGDTTSTDTYTALLQQLIDKYNTAAPAAPATTTAGTTPTDTTA